MPDHLHLLAGTPTDLDFVSFIQHFKQLSSFRFSRQLATIGRLWQSRFFDHALRVDEDLRAAARYILGNPVRAGIVTDAAHYPYSGSLVWQHVLWSSGSEDPDLHQNRTADALKEGM
jgi:REP element-mobilizing transposase RayT